MDAISRLRSRLEEKFKSSTELFPDFTTIRKIAVIPTGSVVLSAITGIGGYPRGRVSEVFGDYSTGKTTLAIEAIVQLQKAQPDAVAAYADYEHAFDPLYARKLGLDLSPDKFIFFQPEYFEQGDEIIDQFASEGLVDLVVIDSAAAMTPKDELEGKVDQAARIGLQAQLMSRMLGRVTKKLSRGRKPALLVLNQTRTKIDIRNPRNTRQDSASGQALKFYSSMRIQLEIMGKEGEEDRASKAVTDQVYTRNRVRAVVIKNKLAPPFMRGQLVIDYGIGVNDVVSVCELAEQKLRILNSSGFFHYAGDTPETNVTGRGREEFAKVVEGNEPLRKELERKIIAALTAEQAAELGLTELQMGTAAKEIQEEPVMLDDRPGPRFQRGEGLPTTEAS